ncbi:MAG: AAA family ATPase [Beijerinckiaceae bacterium]
MDPRKNPYSPGAGVPPPELAGRDEVIEKAAIALDRIRAGRHDRSLILYGLRGVGKTVLLNKIQIDAETKGIFAVKIEAPEERSLPAILIPALRSALLRMNRLANAKDKVKKAMRALGGFANALKIKFNDIEVGIDFESEKGLADSGDLNNDLKELIQSIGEAAIESESAVVLFIDEIQYVEEIQLGNLISALHEATQRKLPVTMVAAGLPQLLGLMGRAKSYSERLFEFVPIDKLHREAATRALIIPAEKEGVEYEEAAINEILEQTKGYPYFLQEWGKHSWKIAVSSPIKLEDARQATTDALAELDASFFRVRFDRLTQSEKRYVRAMAELGAGPHRSGDIAECLGQKVTTAAPMRSTLIAKGMIYSPSHGDTAFTVPLFDGFMKRAMPVFNKSDKLG